MRVMAVNEFCRTFKISRKHAYALVREGALHAVRLGRAVRIIVPDEWLPEPVRPEKQEDTGGRAR